ncbi:protein involved in temperature-dependent protein secretion [Rhodopirellula rubra]|uniref:Protein involved in temperature-dependent protein secretion n=1 Tax=Aporhodopirellula rubra TaxID=980271 RepID=A0A7W5DVQ8_9BACT|nr:protein involved in temperature-dependent protein secretion [Aporhodopirellula rubra]
MPHDDDANVDTNLGEVAEILANGVARWLAARDKPAEKDSPNRSHVGLSSPENDRSL